MLKAPLQKAKERASSASTDLKKVADVVAMLRRRAALVQQLLTALEEAELFEASLY